MTKPALRHLLAAEQRHKPNPAILADRIIARSHLLAATARHGGPAGLRAAAAEIDAYNARKRAERMNP